MQTPTPSVPVAVSNSEALVKLVLNCPVRLRAGIISGLWKVKLAPWFVSVLVVPRDPREQIFVRNVSLLSVMYFTDAELFYLKTSAMECVF